MKQNTFNKAEFTTYMKLINYNYIIQLIKSTDLIYFTIL